MNCELSVISMLIAVNLIFSQTIQAKGFPHSDFNIKIGNPPISGKIQIFWNEGGVEKVMIVDEKGKVFQAVQTGEDWTNLGAPEDQTRKSIVNVVDANFDGNQDFLIETSEGTAGQLFQLFLYDSKLKKFKRNDALKEIWNPTFIEKAKTIHTLEIPEGAEKEKDVAYQWSGNQLKRIRSK